MPRKKSSLLTDLSTADLKRLLAARERIDVLEKEKTGLVKQLAKVEKELDKLMSGATGTGMKKTRKVRRKKAGKKTAKKARKKAGAGKTGKKKVVAKKVVRKKVVRKKVARKKVVRKKVGRKKPVARKGAAKKAPVRKATGGGKMILEDVVLAVIRKNKAPIAFQDLKARILKGRLFKTKSGNFDNVLRRTLSTSKKVKRVGRGIYDAA